MKRLIQGIGFFTFIVIFTACTPLPVAETETGGIEATSTVVVLPPSPTPVDTLTAIPSPSSDTVTITPPEERVWEAMTVLVHIYTGPGFTSEAYAWSSVSDLVVYRDGRVIAERYGDELEGAAPVLVEGQLSPPELCRLLGQIEADGFFNFDPATYEAPMVTDMGYTEMTVRAWRRQSLNVYGLGFTVAHQHEDEYSGYAPPGLTRTYQWMADYVPSDAVPFVPESVQMWVLQDEGTGGETPRLWESETISLTAWMAAQGDTNEFGRPSFMVQVEGSDAQHLWDVLGRDRTDYFRQGENYFRVTVRPVLPYETRPADRPPWGDAPQFELEPAEMMDCSGAE